jgi:type IV secretory pathway ATPase VirB11/archaellum biosynthesis ATPase
MYAKLIASRSAVAAYVQEKGKYQGKEENKRENQPARRAAKVQRVAEALALRNHKSAVSRIEVQETCFPEASISAVLARDDNPFHSDCAERHVSHHSQTEHDSAHQ